MIYIKTSDKNDIKMNIDEILRYSGFGKGEIKPYVMQRINEVKDEIFSALSCRACFAICDMSVENNIVDFGTFCAKSEKLAKNLKDCEKAVVFCATVGIQIDRIIAKYSKLSQSIALIAQAAGASAIENFCDVLCEQIEEKLKKDGFFLRPRFSPGYGDFDISYQRDIFRLLDCTRKIGVSYTDSLQMIPSKSVTAVLGISRENMHCSKNGCESCSMHDTCIYSRR